MDRRWVWIMAIGLVLVGGAWNSAAAAKVFDLSKLKSLCVGVENVDPISNRDFDLNTNAIENYVYVWVRGKIPRLPVEIMSADESKRNICGKGSRVPLMIVTIRLGASESKGGENLGYFGSVGINVSRATRWETGNAGYGIAYMYHWVIQGPKGSAAQHVNETLDTLLTNFAAEYYKAGNP